MLMKLTPGGGVLARCVGGAMMMGRAVATSCPTSTGGSGALFFIQQYPKILPQKHKIPKPVNPMPQKKISWGKMLYSWS